MSNSKRCNYKGYCITTQWNALHPADRRSGYAAAFAVCPIARDGESWQQFPDAVFDTPESAEANALGAARGSIDELVGAADGRLSEQDASVDRP